MQAERVLDLTRGYNLRELGGYPTTSGHTVKWHKLLRSGSLNALTKADIEALLNYGVTYDIDFRSRHEIKAAPDPFDEQDVTYHRLSVLPFTNREEEVPAKQGGVLKKIFGVKQPAKPALSSIQKMNQQLVLDPHAQAAYRDLFTVLLNNHDTNGAVLYHCSAGKDRTGIATMLVLSALGVDRATIEADYLLTNDVLGLTSENPQTIASNDAQEPP
jgi:protein-tyrosine phosphatase